MKQKYPNYYLWTGEIFSCDLYKDFESQVLASVAENEQMFSTSQMVQAVLPDLASTITTGFEQLASKLQVLQSKQEAMDQRMEANDKHNAQIFADFFAWGHNHFNGNSSSSSPSLVSSLPSAAPNDAQASPAAPSSYCMNRSIVTIVDVWREYEVGLGNGPP